VRFGRLSEDSDCGLREKWAERAVSRERQAGDLTYTSTSHVKHILILEKHDTDQPELSGLLSRSATIIP